MAVQNRVYTVDEFEALIAQPENGDRLLELIDGEINEKMPTQEHGVIAAIVVAELRQYIKQTGTGRVGVEVRHQMPDDKRNSRLPDVSYYAERSSPLIKIGAVPHMPDLAVEVKSPDDALGDLRAKARYYLANGSRRVWLILPDKRLVEIYAADDEQILTEADHISGGDLLPGFTLPVREIFEG
jgi:Uma2 family endonuclease